MRPLSAKGQADAERVAECLDTAQPVAIYSSPYRRARQTVEPLAARLGVPIHEHTDLRERTLSAGPAGEFEAAVHATWADFDFAHPGGEPNRDAQRRVVAVHTALARRHATQSVVLSTHGNLLALLLNYYDPSVGFDFWRALSTPDIYRLTLSPRREATVERMWVGSVGL